METRRTVLKYIAGAVGASAMGLDALESFAHGISNESDRPNIVCLVGEAMDSW